MFGRSRAMEATHSLLAGAVVGACLLAVYYRRAAAGLFGWMFRKARAAALALCGAEASQPTSNKSGPLEETPLESFFAMGVRFARLLAASRRDAANATTPENAETPENAAQDDQEASRRREQLLPYKHMGDRVRSVVESLTSDGNTKEKRATPPGSVLFLGGRGITLEVAGCPILVAHRAFTIHGSLVDVEVDRDPTASCGGVGKQTHISISSSVSAISTLLELVNRTSRLTFENPADRKDRRVYEKLITFIDGAGATPCTNHIFLWGSGPLFSEGPIIVGFPWGPEELDLSRDALVVPVVVQMVSGQPTVFKKGGDTITIPLASCGDDA